MVGGTIPTLKGWTIFFGMLALATLGGRVEDFDDAWFAEQSYWLLKNGHVRSEFFRGMLGWEHQLFVYHKLFVWIGAGLMWLTGISVYGSKLISLLFGFLWLIYNFLYFRRKGQLLGSWWSALLLFSNGLFIEYIFVNRPEVMVATLGFISFYYLTSTTRHQWIWGAIAGGLATLTHLNGLIFLMAGGLWLLTKQRWAEALGWGIIGSVVLSFYFTDVITQNAWAVWWHQFHNDPATRSVFDWQAKLDIMFSLHELLFHSEEEVALSLLLIACTWFGRKHLQALKNEWQYGLLLMASFALITKSNFWYYYVLFLPIATVFIANLLIMSNLKKGWLSVLLIGYCLVGVVKVGKMLYLNYTTPALVRANQNLTRYLPKTHVRVLAPLSFFYNQVEHYDIQGDFYYVLRNENDFAGQRLSSSFFTEIKQQRIQYVILERSRWRSYANLPLPIPRRLEGFRVSYQDKSHVMLVREGGLVK